MDEEAVENDAEESFETEETEYADSEYEFDTEGTEQTEEEAAEQEAYERFLLKVNGQEEEVVYKSRDELLRDIQKGRAADRKFQESARLRQEYEKLVNTLKNEDTFVDALLELGYTEEQIDLMAEARVTRKVEELFDPEAAKRKREQQELARYRAMEEQRQLAIEQDYWDQEIRTTLASSANLPDDSAGIQAFYTKMIDVLLEAENSGRPMTAQQALPYVEQYFRWAFPAQAPKKPKGPPTLRTVGSPGKASGEVRSKRKKLSLKDL